MKEELGYEVKIVKLVSIIQNFFKAKDGRKFHELGYYYIVEPTNLDEVNLEDYIRMENDKGEMKRLEFRWFDLETLKDTRFLPEILKEKLTSDVLENIITKD